MRVLHVIPTLEAAGGGVTSAVAGLALAQRRAGLDVAILATFVGEPDQTLIDTLHAGGVRVTVVGPATGRFLRHPDLRRVTAQAVRDADVVHVAALWEELQHQAARECRRQRVPYVVSPHGMLDPWSLRNGSRWAKRLYMALRLRRDLNAAAALHFTCAVERDLTASLRLRAPAIVEPNGIDLSEFAELPPADALRDRYPQIAGRPVVLFLSRVDPKKGLDLLVPAFARCGVDDAVLVIAGPDSVGYGAAVAAMVRDHGLGERVIFTGMLRGRERVEAFAGATLFALPSYQENFGIAVVEALAAGVPVLISDQVNIHAEITAAGVGGVVPTRVEPLAAALGQWLRDEPLRREAATRARPFVWERYDWQNIAEHWVGHYRRLSGAGSREAGQLAQNASR